MFFAWCQSRTLMLHLLGQPVVTTKLYISVFGITSLIQFLYFAFYRSMKMFAVVEAVDVFENLQIRTENTLFE